MQLPLLDLPARVKRLLQSDDVILIRRILMEQGAHHWKSFALVVVLMVIVAGCTAAMAFLLGDIINVAYLDRNFAGVVTVAVLLIVLCVIKGFARYGQEILRAWIGNRIVAESQKRIFDKLLHEGVGYFANRHSSEFMASAIHGARAATNVLNLLIMALGQDLLTLIGLISLMLWKDPILTLIGFCVMPVAIFGVQKLKWQARNIAQTEFTAAAKILQTMQETVQGFRIIKAFNVEDSLRRRIGRDITSIENASNKMARVSHKSAPLTEMLGGIGIALVCLYGGYRVLVAGATPGGFVTFMIAFLLTFEPLRRFATLNVNLTSGLVFSRVLFNLLDSKPSEPDDSDMPDLLCDRGLIRFSDVDFSYNPETPVLKGVSFVAETEQLTALVGPSGGGKSTIFNLLLRFYHPQSGSITIDDQSIVDVRRGSLRSKIAFVGQDNFLFRGTIRDNILIGRPDATQDQLVAAAKAAQAHEFIAALPEGYDSQVGEFGTQLSHGQRQRLAVARALIKDAPIVLLDEPTASLDSESESKVQQAIQRLCAGRTTLVIAHRLNTIMHADQIYVLEEGRIVESGHHDGLLRRNGRYATFFRLQFPDQDTGVMQKNIETA